MKFINTHKLSSVANKTDMPHQYDLFWHDPQNIPTKKDEFLEYIADNNISIDVDWWNEQKRRCMHGYSIQDGIDYNSGDLYIEGENVKRISDDEVSIPHLGITIKGTELRITGRHYFYLNFWNIKMEKGDKKGRSNPYFTDLSWENWWIRAKMKRDKKNNIYGKTRQRGLSQEEAANMGFDFLMFDDVQLAIIAGQDIYNINTMNMVRDGLSDIYNTQFYKELAHNTDRYVKSKNTGSEIHSRTAKDNAQILSGLTPYHTLFEEIGIWKRGLIIDCYNFLRPSMYSTGKKLSYCSFVGTAGYIEDSVADMEYIMYHPSEFDLLEFDNIYDDNATGKTGYFVPGYKYELIDEFGNSKKSESIESIKEEIKKAENPKNKHYITITKPLKIGDMFNIASGGFFGEAITMYCNRQKAKINSLAVSILPYRYSLEWIDRRDPFKGVTYRLDPEGVFVISELPIFGKDKKPVEDLYCAGTDSYDQDESNTSKSKGCCVIKKGVYLDEGFAKVGIHNAFVAYVLERPSENEGGKETFFEYTALLSMFYNAPNLIEHTKVTIFDWYKEHGLSGLMMESPQIAISTYVDDSKTVNRYGCPSSLIDPGLKIFRDQLAYEDNIQNIYLPELLEAYARFRRAKNYNCDITIASMLANLAMYEKKELMLSGERKVPEKKSIYGFKSNSGIIKKIA